MMSRTESDQRTVASDVFIACPSAKEELGMYSLMKRHGWMRRV